MELRVERVVSAPAEDAWAVVGEHFGQIGEWASAITESVMDGQPGVGQIRTCHIAGFGPIALGVIRERLVDFDPEARSLSYEAAEGMPDSSCAPSAAGRCTRDQALRARSGFMRP